MVDNEDDSNEVPDDIDLRESPDNTRNDESDTNQDDQIVNDGIDKLD